MYERSGSMAVFALVPIWSESVNLHYTWVGETSADAHAMARRGMAGIIFEDRRSSGHDTTTMAPLVDNPQIKDVPMHLDVFGNAVPWLGGEWGIGPEGVAIDVESCWV